MLVCQKESELLLTTLSSRFTNESDFIVESCNAQRSDEPGHVDREGDVVDDATSGYGYPIDIVIANPEFIRHVRDWCLLWRKVRTIRRRR